MAAESVAYAYCMSQRFSTCCGCHFYNVNGSPSFFYHILHKSKCNYYYYVKTKWLFFVSKRTSTEPDYLQTVLSTLYLRIRTNTMKSGEKEKMCHTEAGVGGSGILRLKSSLCWSSLNSSTFLLISGFSCIWITAENSKVTNHLHISHHV